MEEKKKISEWFKRNRIKVSDGQINSLLGHIDMVREYSPKLNLISKKDLPNVIERHLLDSLRAFLTYDIPRNIMAADVGSGAGYPGIPIAILRPDIQMYLIESRRKRSLFLSKVINAIGLANAIVINDRWENLNLIYDLIFARAVIKEADILGKLKSRLAPGGAILYFAKYNHIKVFRE